MKEDTAIESELLIQDWNKDDIKFTEIETVDIIKAKPLKESMTDKEFMKTDVEMKNNAAAGVSVSQEKQNDYVKEVNRRLKLKNQKKVVAGENKFKTKQMKKEHYDWKAELTEMGIKKINGDEEIIKPEGKTLKKGKERDGVFKLKKGVNLDKAHYEPSNWRDELSEKCWKGYEKKGMKTMFGKRYPNCVKKSKKKK